MRTHRPRPRPPTVLLVLVVLLLPVAAWAVDDAFDDVPASNTHHDAITAVRDAGVTQGCSATSYCPRELVRRDQMASFLARLGGLAGRPPVVNAATVQGLAPEELGGVVARTSIPYSQTTNTVTGFTMTFVRDLGEVTKQLPGTTLRLRLNSHVGGPVSATTACSFQLRVDGVNRTGGTGLDGADAVVYSQHAPIALEVDFEGLAPGARTVSLWVRANQEATTCTENNGNFPRLLVVEELAVASGG